LSTKVTPDGRAPDSARAAVGVPVEVTVKVPADPSVKVVADPEVMVGGASTVRVKDWVTGLPMPLPAEMMRGKTPPSVGVPDNVAVPSPLSTNATPVGRVPDSDRAAVGSPVEVTVKVPADPSVKVVADPEVMVGETSTVRVKA
jgi:hypothetical protein